MFGGWSISKGIFTQIRNLIPEGSKIVEFGSGNGTDELLKHYTVVSFEHDKGYLKQRGKNHFLTYAPLKDGWYDIPGCMVGWCKPDLVLVDGPPGELRKNMILHYDLFEGLACPFVFDDVNRKTDYDSMIAFCEHFKYDYEIFRGTQKSFAVCLKK